MRSIIQLILISRLLIWVVTHPLCSTLSFELGVNTVLEKSLRPLKHPAFFGGAEKHLKHANWVSGIVKTWAKFANLSKRNY